MGELFQRSAHEGLRSAGVFAVGMVQRTQRAQDLRDAPETVKLRQVNLAAAVPQAARCLCGAPGHRHGVAMEVGVAAT
ncbi:hypothetical protein [Micromonospora humida]|uniref:hypothetical protein n=1 Tax=Micromonospora humida TaxID=2809018 RepID=UPI0034377DD4